MDLIIRLIKVFELLGDLYFVQSGVEKDLIIRSQNREKSLQNFNEALDIAKKTFPSNSSHIKRIEVKFKELMMV